MTDVERLRPLTEQQRKLLQECVEIHEQTPWRDKEWASALRAALTLDDAVRALGTAGAHSAEDAAPPTADGQVEALRAALERAEGCIMGLLRRTPVRDVTETLCEVSYVLRGNTDGTVRASMPERPAERDGATTDARPLTSAELIAAVRVRLRDDGFRSRFGVTAEQSAIDSFRAAIRRAMSGETP